MTGLEPWTASETKLLNSVEQGQVCDFDPNDENPVIRAGVLKAFLNGDATVYGAPKNAPILIRNARIEGDLELLEGVELPTVSMRSCVFMGTVDFKYATFGGDVELSHSEFYGTTNFLSTTFRRMAYFEDTTFDDNSYFDGARFGGLTSFEGASFNGSTSFERATFQKGIRFTSASFAADASFGSTKVQGFADFSRATFRGDASFDSARFEAGSSFDDAAFGKQAQFWAAKFDSSASFAQAVFGDSAHFMQAEFSDDANFRNAVFVGGVGFGNVTFASAARFHGSVARRLSFGEATFASADVGPWCAVDLSLAGTVFDARTVVTVTAKKVDAARIVAREGMHLALRCESIDLSDSEFPKRSVVSTRTARDSQIRAVGDADLSEELRGHVDGLILELERLINKLPPRAQISSLTGSNIGDLVLSDVVLDDCSFAGGLGLDKLRIGPGCSLARRTQPWATRRAVIADELRWRGSHTPLHVDGDFVPAAEIAGTYRELRKGLEDAKNEPGAADFYYGEMEMRRLAGRWPHTRRGRPRRPAPGFGPTRPSYAERVLLFGYWAVSGYGLRAWRALACLAVLVVVAAWLYTYPMFAMLAPAEEHPSSVDLQSGRISYTAESATTKADFATTFEYSLRETISLLQTHNDPKLDVTGAGVALEIALRLGGPACFALAVLAIRGRTKR